jgi:hypothetical protein
VQRLPFLTAVAADGQAQVEWLRDQLRQIHVAMPEHGALVSALNHCLDIARARIDSLELIIAAAHPELVPRAMPVVHQLEYLTGTVGVTFLPALRGEGDGERFVRGVLFAAARAAGMTWLRDIVAKLDRPHAAIVTFPEMPIVYAPPRHQVALADMPGLYHELAHAVFARDQAIGAALRASVRAHFAEHRRRGGTLTAEKRSARERDIARADAYWDDERLAELFCDIFATAICGPAHYVSFVELGLRHNRDPYALESSEHPPLSARVSSCFQALAIHHRKEPVVRAMADAWKAHGDVHAIGHDYRLACDSSLIDELVRVARIELSRTLPDHVMFSEPLRTDSALFEIDDQASLETILNQAATIQFLYPRQYSAWEPGALERLREIATLESNARDTRLLSATFYSGGQNVVGPVTFEPRTDRIRRRIDSPDCGRLRIGKVSCACWRLEIGQSNESLAN